jgi:hypothetical protein
MLCDVPEGLERPPAEYGTYLNSYHEFQEAFCTNGQSVSNDIRRDQLLVQQTETFNLARSRYPPGRRYCITSGGHVGWVSQKGKMGDVLAILKGGDIVYALRHHREDSNTYELLGGCYLHGFMYGEGMADTSIELSRDLSVLGHCHLDNRNRAKDLNVTNVHPKPRELTFVTVSWRRLGIICRWCRKYFGYNRGLC